jgi:predicted transcriptional regulator
MKTFELELPDDIVDQLDEAARVLDMTPEDLVREGIEEKLRAMVDEFRVLSSYLYVVDYGVELYRPPA